MNKSRRKFLGKAPAVAIGAGIGVASGKIAMASQSTWPQGTRPLLDAVIAGQAKYNGLIYVGNDLLLDVLRMVVPHVQGLDLAAATAKLNQAAEYIENIPGADPPGCCVPGALC